MWHCPNLTSLLSCGNAQLDVLVTKNSDFKNKSQFFFSAGCLYEILPHMLLNYCNIAHYTRLINMYKNKDTM